MSPPSDSLRSILAHPAFSDPETASFLLDKIEQSPDPIAVAQTLIRYSEKNGLPRDRHQLLILLTLAGQSPFLADLMLQNPGYLAWVSSEMSRDEGRTPEDLRQDLARFRFTFSTLSDAAALRRFKHREYLRIALRDFLGNVDLAETTHELSVLADVLLQEAYLLTWRELRRRYGAPQYFDDRGLLCEATFAVLSFGKLGGDELNYSSDIDLTYVYSRDGQTSGGADLRSPAVSNKEFFTRLGEGIHERISGISPEGRVFRVDLDLRPGGKDGELVQSRRSLLAYYRSWARNWERQALLKARHSAGDRDLGEGVLAELQSAIFPPSGTPFAALEIKEMKDRIDEVLSRSGRSDTDIKLGSGGLRELEFAVQALQLREGGEDAWLRGGNTLRALHRLADKRFVSYGEHFALSRAYDYLRKVEHRLQMEHNVQSSVLPSGHEELRRLARRLGYYEAGQEAASFLRDLNLHRAAIRAFYDSVFGRLAQVPLGKAERDLLLDPVSEAELASFLTASRALRPDEAARHLGRIRHLFASGRIGPGQRREMRRVSAAILSEAISSAEPERAFMNLERFLSSLLVDPEGSRHLLEKAEWIPPLIRVFGKSESLSQILVRRPTILAEMGSTPDFLRERTSQELTSRLAALLEGAEGVRAAAATLRRFHQREVLHIGFRDVHRQDGLSGTLRALTDLAQACLAAGDAAAARFGGDSPETRFTILALGRLGYQELDYNSDLDLVFLSEAPGGPAETVRKRAEILIHLLTAVTQEGSLYNVDLRLRPAGREGELVQTRSGTIDYFRRRAQTWEKLAFLKARPVGGDAGFGREVVASVQTAIFEETDASRLASEVLEMKKRLEEAPAAEAAGGLPLKLGVGGVMDIHFLIEFLQILHRLPGPDERDTLRMLTHLHERRLLPPDEYQELYSGYLLLRSLDHAMRLLYDRPGDLLPLAPSTLSRLALEVSLPESGASASGEAPLLAHLRRTRDSIRRSFLRVLS
jgi:[glutamine synthetase] adenylyltransferase / [glutamine synthetase]-adenylyl-L-tyrosine phosphorylase